jgi:acyl carrier protein
MTVTINTPVSPKAAVEDGIRALLAAKLQIEANQIPRAATLGELGFDSLGLSDLAEGIEEGFGIQVPNRTLPATLTLSQLINLLSQAEESSESIHPGSVPSQSLQ